MSHSPKPYDLASLFAALADPTRLRLLNLMSGKEVCVCYFVEILGEGQPKVSRHLAYLRRAGLVASRREGKWMHYSLRTPKHPSAARILSETLAALRENRVMQGDLRRLSQACCVPQKISALEDAPIPTAVDATNSCRC
jgi:ArsR family transcriptional regulator, arsenate/arsenite/antimonite-responsive transcriptional repressor